MPSIVKYYYVGDSPPNQSQSPPGNWNLFDTNNSFNNIFNFPSNFFQSLNGISPIDLGKAVPYVSLKTLDVNGTVLEDLNLKFFHNGIDFSQINSGVRYSDRPIMSLKNIDIKTNNASGYLFYTEVTLKLKIHRPDQLTNSTLVSLMFPGQPLLLEYGWHSNTDNDLLNIKDILYFAVKTYTITLDETGQIDLTVEGMSLNEQFSNAIIGDTGAAVNTALTDNEGTINASLAQLQEISQYLQDLLSRGGNNGANYQLLKKQAEKFQNKEKRVRGAIATQFQSKLSILRNGPTFPLSVPNSNDPNNSGNTIQCFTVNDIVSSLCHETFTAMTSLFPGVNEFRIIYGNLNENCGDYSNKSIADFPIQKKMFLNKIKQEVGNGDIVMNVEKLINNVIYEFMENEEYWKKLLASGANVVFDKPDIAINFYGHRNRDGNAYVDLYIVDAKAGVPPTLSRMPDGNGSQESIKNAVIEGTSIPVLSFGHANSFIKNISLTQFSDQYMKAALISKMSEERLSSVRSTVIPGLDLYATPIPPLTLPLRGTAEVLGCTEWKPFRSFFLSSGIFLVDGIYKIVSVKHSLSPSGFNTSIEFMWH
jgi:hypothetical protein